MSGRHRGDAEGHRLYRGEAERLLPGGRQHDRARGRHSGGAGVGVKLADEPHRRTRRRPGPDVILKRPRARDRTDPTMLEMLAALPLLFAADAPAAGATSSPMTQLLPLLPIPILFYFLMIRPKQLEDRKRQEMIGALKKNDKVLTIAGIYGTVVSVSDTEDEVVVKVDDNTRLRMQKASIARNISGEEAAKAAKEQPKETK